MNPKETIFTAFKREPTERIPVTLFGGGMWTITHSANTFLGLANDAVKMADIIIETARLLDCDVVYVGSGYNNLHVASLGGKIKYRQVGAPDLEEPLVNNPDDLKKLNLDAIDRNEVVATIIEATKRVAAAIGHEYAVTTTSWGPFTLAAQIYGVERLMRGTFKSKELVKEVIDFSTDFVLRFYEPLLASGSIELISLADPTASGDLISRKQFQEFALPYLQKVTGRMRSRGIATLLHICGDTSDRLDLLAQSGADCISLDHKVDLARAKRELGSQVCIGGNVNPVAVLNNGTAGQVEEVCRKCVEQAAEGGSFVLMPGCDIPPSVPLENIQTFVRVAHSWKAS